MEWHDAVSFVAGFAVGVVVYLVRRYVDWVSRRMSLHLGARWARWRHCLRGMFTGHSMMTVYGVNGRVVAIGCSCGVVFWEDAAYGSWWAAAFEAGRHAARKDQR